MSSPDAPRSSGCNIERDMTGLPSGPVGILEWRQRDSELSSAPERIRNGPFAMPRGSLFKTPSMFPRLNRVLPGSTAFTRSGGVRRDPDDNVDLDTCPTCHVPNIIDREKCLRVCPVCARCASYASHVHDSKDDRVSDTCYRQNPNTRTFLKQFELGHRPDYDQKQLHHLFSKYHSRSVNKVSIGRLGKLLRPGLRRELEFIRMEMTGAPRPGFTKQQILRFLNHTLPKETKSNNNQHLLRKFANHPGMGAARLFAKGKKRQQPSDGEDQKNSNE